LLSARKLLLKSALSQDLSSQTVVVKGPVAERNTMLRDGPGEEESFCASFFLANKSPARFHAGQLARNRPATEMSSSTSGQWMP
jgi:hypothetical protein